ncbi:abortive infection family protein [Patescibacteria group bacterium]|nr:abortive infection family protein [Patescibacteria group bacterium]
MTEKILKSSISVLEAFNEVRNNKSFANDNHVLNYNESILIFNDMANVIRFIESIDPKEK